MRKIIVFTNISLDGYFEGPDHDISGFKNDTEAFSSPSGDPVDTLLFGHTTYEMMKFWETAQAQTLMPEVARFMNDTLKCVASHQPFDPGWQNVQVLHGDVIAQVRRLKASAAGTDGGAIMIFGSNTLVVSLLQAGLIDEFQLIVNPVVLSAGTPIFAGLPEKTELEFKSARPFQSGAVMLTYTPAT